MQLCRGVAKLVGAGTGVVTRGWRAGRGALDTRARRGCLQFSLVLTLSCAGCMSLFDCICQTSDIVKVYHFHEVRILELLV